MRKTVWIGILVAAICLYIAFRGISMREPFGSCEMKYVTDLSQIASEYHYTAAHPMIVDPCNHAVYDLEKYGPGPNGVVRGAIVYGAGWRSPRWRWR